MENPQGTPRQASVRDLAAVIFRQKWVILTIFVVTTVSVFLLNLSTPTTYESMSTVRVERGRKETTLNPNLRVLPWTEEISSELETVKSYPVAKLSQAILDEWSEEGKISRPIHLNRGGVTAGVIGESNVINISYTSQDASVCRPVTDALTEAYTRFRHQAMEIPEATRFFSERITGVEKDLAALEEEKDGYLGKVGAESSRSREDDLANQLATVESQRHDLDTEIDVLEKQLATGRDLVKRGKLDATFFTELGYQNVWVLNQLRENLMKARMSREELASSLTPEHPKLKAAEASLATAETMLGDEVRSTLALMETQLQEKKTKRDRLMSLEAEYSATLGAIPRYGVVISRLDNDIELKREELKDLNQKQLLSQVNTATTPDYTVTLLSPASPPYAKKTKDYVRMALAPLMSLVVGLLLAFFLDSLDHSVRSSLEVEEHLGLPVLASLPESRN